MKRDFREARPDEWQQDNRKPKPDGSGYEDLVTTNAAFEEYYQKQVWAPPSWSLHSTTPSFQRQARGQSNSSA